MSTRSPAPPMPWLTWCSAVLRPKLASEWPGMKLETLNDIFFHAVERDLPRVMSVKRDGRWIDISSRQLKQQVFSVASALKRRGIKKGDRVAILSENRAEWQIADFACLLLGAVDVPVY